MRIRNTQRTARPTASCCLRYAIRIRNAQYAAQPTASCCLRYAIHIRYTQYAAQPKASSQQLQYTTQYAIHNAQPAPQDLWSRTLLQHSLGFPVHNTHTQYAVHSSSHKVVCRYTLVSLNTQSLNTQCQPYDPALESICFLGTQPSLYVRQTRLETL